MKTVLDIGNCDADHSFIKGMLHSNFGATLIRAHKLDDALAALKDHDVDLIMFNRLLDTDGSEGMDVFREIKASEFGKIPAMLITNFEDHQKAAIAEGAVPGFGKAAMHATETVDTVKQALGISS